MENARIKAAASNNATLIKAGVSKVYGVDIIGLTASACWIKLYDTSDVPDPATDGAKIVWEYKMPLYGGTDPGSVVKSFTAGNDSNGLTFVNGIGLALVAGDSDTDNTAVAAGVCLVNVQYQ